MIKIERKWAVIVAAILGLFAVALTRVYFSQKEEQLRLEETHVLIATQDIARGTTLAPDMMAFKSMPVKYIQPGVLRSKGLVVGKTALVEIMAGEQILATKLATPGKGLTLAGRTPAGKRAVTIGLDAASSVGGMIRPGDHVDILASFNTPQIILRLMENVLILAVGQEMMIKPEEEERASRAPARGGTVTFALSPQEAQVLKVAMRHGDIQLILRPRMETSRLSPEVDLSTLPPALNLNDLLKYYIRRPEPPPSIEIIRGLEKQSTPLPLVKEEE